MPVTLAMLAIDRSISAHRITKVRPTAMMPVTETWVRILAKLSSVANEGLAAAKKPVMQISVRNGAMLRICERSIWPRLRGRLPPGGTVAPSLLAIFPPPSGRFEQAVLADHFACEFAHHHAALQHEDAVGERQHRLRLGRQHDDGQALVAHGSGYGDDVVLGAAHHA